MKKTLLTAAVLGAIAGTVFAQGTISVKFLATSDHIYYTTDGTAAGDTVNPAGNPNNIPGYGSVTIAVYSAAPGTPLLVSGNTTPVFDSNWHLAATKITAFGSPGFLAATTIILNGIAEGASAQVEIVGWTGAFTDFNSALASATGGGAVLLGWTGSTLSGGAFSWTQGTGSPNGSPATLPTATPYGAGGVKDLTLQPLTITPEPSTIALGGLGAAALLLFRRRK